MKKLVLLLVLFAGCVQPNGTLPGPGPGPGPAPAPDAVVTSPAMRVVTVDDYGTRTPDVTATLYKLSTEKIAPHRFREYDVQNEEWRRWQGQVDAAGGPPCVFFLDLKTGQPVGKPAKLPGSWDDLRGLIDKYTAK